MVHLHLTVKTNLLFSHWPETETAHTHKFVSAQHEKKTFERPQCIPNMRFVREEAYSSSYWLIWRLRRPRFHYIPQISCTTWCQIQTFGFVNASILLIKNRKRKVEREVNLKTAEEIKGGGESSWWQGDCKPNRTRTVTAILESAMNKEEGQEERLSEHQFS